MRLPDDKVPAAGAWAQCPRCLERFFINPAGMSFESLTTPAPRPAAPRSRRDEAGRELLSRLKNRQGEHNEAPFFEPGLVTVYPQAAVSEIVQRAMASVLLCLPLLAVGYLFYSASSSRADRPPEPEQLPAVAKVNDNSSLEIIRKDLVNIRRDLASRQSQPKGIDYSGPEVRVFKYFMARLTPDVCSGIHYLEIKPTAAAGFRALGHCVDPTGLVLEMRVEWDGLRSLVSFPQYGQAEELEIYPPPRSQSAALTTDPR
jgi:hypothetical protein